jgi:hypothetical protein
MVADTSRNIRPKVLPALNHLGRSPGLFAIYRTGGGPGSGLFIALHVVRGPLPSWTGEAIVTRLRLNHCLSSHGRTREALPLRQRRASQRRRLERRIRSVGGPIEERETDGAGRSPTS